MIEPQRTNPGRVYLCAPTHLLLHHGSLPPWFQRRHGSAIQLGFRPTDHSFTFYLASLCSLHNETVNIWSHLIGSLAFLSLLFDDSDSYMIAYRLASAACFFTSAMYHTFMPANERVYARLQRLDYASIFVLIGVSAIPWYSVEYACSRTLELVAVVSTAGMIILLAWLVGTQDWFAKDTAWGRLVRVVAFSAFACTCTIFGGMATIVLDFSPQPYFEAERWIAINLWIVTVLYVAGPVIYATGVPERWRPGTVFDLVGASHQAMHVCVVAAALINGWCMQRARALMGDVTDC